MLFVGCFLLLLPFATATFLDKLKARSDDPILNPKIKPFKLSNEPMINVDASSNFNEPARIDAKLPIGPDFTEMDACPPSRIHFYPETFEYKRLLRGASDYELLAMLGQYAVVRGADGSITERKLLPSLLIPEIIYACSLDRFYKLSALFEGDFRNFLKSSAKDKAAFALLSGYRKVAEKAIHLLDMYSAQYSATTKIEIVALASYQNSTVFLELAKKLVRDKIRALTERSQSYSCSLLHMIIACLSDDDASALLTYTANLEDFRPSVLSINEAVYCDFSMQTVQPPTTLPPSGTFGALPANIRQLVRKKIVPYSSLTALQIAVKRKMSKTVKMLVAKPFNARIDGINESFLNSVYGTDDAGKNAMKSLLDQK